MCMCGLRSCNCSLLGLDDESLGLELFEFDLTDVDLLGFVAGSDLELARSSSMSDDIELGSSDSLDPGL